MKYLYAIATLLLLAALSLLVAGQAGLLAGNQPQNLGVSAGRLLPPSDTPNSVSSQASLYPDHPQRDYAQIAPLRYSGDGEAAMRKLAEVLAGTPGTRIIEQRADYLYAQSRTTWLKFTDDLEFWLDRDAGVIQLRSASRLGRKDFDKNRARIEEIRGRF